MEDSRPAPLARRASDHAGAKRFFRFDPTVSTGTLLQLGAIAVAVTVAYGTYREDRTQIKADIEQVKLTAERDRKDVVTAVEQFRGDVKEMKADIKDVSAKLAEVKGQNAAALRGR